VEQLTVLITSNGKWVLPGGEEFLAELGDPNPDYDAVGFAVRNLGFIKFQVLDRLVTEIELHPRNVQLPALLAVERQLKEPGTKLFRIKYLESEWHSEIFASAEHTIGRLRELCTPAAELPSSERFHVEARDPAILMRDVGNPLRNLTQKWRTSFGNFDKSVVGLSCRSGLLSLMVITGFDKSESSPIFRFIGDEHRWTDRQHLISGIGEKLESIEDKEYGHWASEFHRVVAASGQPRYDHVTATTESLKQQGRPRQTFCYERLLLPWRGSTGEVLITSCAKKVEPAASSAEIASESSVVK